MAKNAKSYGYRTRLMAVWAQEENAIARVRERNSKTNRHVSEQKARKIYPQCNQAILKYLETKDEFFDAITVYDNNRKLKPADTVLKIPAPILFSSLSVWKILRPNKKRSALAELESNSRSRKKSKLSD